MSSTVHHGLLAEGELSKRRAAANIPLYHRDRPQGAALLAMIVEVRRGIGFGRIAI